MKILLNRLSFLVFFLVLTNNAVADRSVPSAHVVRSWPEASQDELEVVLPYSNVNSEKAKNCQVSDLSSQIYVSKDCSCDDNGICTVGVSKKSKNVDFGYLDYRVNAHTVNDNTAKEHIKFSLHKLGTKDSLVVATTLIEIENDLVSVYVHYERDQNLNGMIILDHCYTINSEENCAPMPPLIPNILSNDDKVFSFKIEVPKNVHDKNGKKRIPQFITIMVKPLDVDGVYMKHESLLKLKLN
ncbi:MAG: hypothetical protein HOO06_05285 [Bdellovibrionaceae bacterium]|nr:hypothetical protein [Pseudobdellovibrionaceae bacterium]